jgi:hypothetical protein
MHMTADRSKGVIVWVEDPSPANQKIVRRLEFTVDAYGNLHPGEPVTILPLAGEKPLLGDYLYYEVGDVWGDATHDSLYITVLRVDSFNPGTDTETGARNGSIYDLNTLNNENDSTLTTEHLNYPAGWMPVTPRLSRIVMPSPTLSMCRRVTTCKA